jgi:hypothetical protein
MNYWQPYAWSIEQQGNKYIVGKWTTEVMRLSADGSLGIGGSKQAIEQHEFQTLEWAQIMLKFCQGLDQQSNSFAFTNSTIVWDTTNGKINNSWNYYFANKAIVQIDSNGKIVKLDLPFIVWEWLKLSKVSKFIKTLMWGERGKNDRKS